MNKFRFINIYCLFIITYSFGLVSPSVTNAQVAPSRYFITFTDRNNSPYTLSNPAAFLSSKAIARRAANGIPLVENDLPVNPQYIDSVVSKGAAVLNRSKWFNGLTIYVTDSTILNAVLALPFVVSSKEVQPRKANKSFMSQYKHDVITNVHHEAMRTTDQYDFGFSYNQIGMIHLDSLHVHGYTGSGKTIAMLDDGFYNIDSIAAFDSVRINNQILGTWDFVNNNGDIFHDSVDNEGNLMHGMWTFSIIGGNLPGSLVGAAPKADFFLLRTEQNASEYIIEEYNWDSGAEYADSAGADILSTSLGYTTFDDSTQNHTYASMNGRTCPITIAAEIAASKGMLVVNSAGNEGDDSWQYISAPADGDSVLTIGAVDPSGVYAGFSGKGPTSDGRLKPNVVAQGESDAFADADGGITFGDGTSFSCPIIAGAAACLWEKYPAASNMEIFKAIEESASQYNDPDTLVGYGIPNFYTANVLLAGLTKEINQQSFTVYPNPVSSYLTITYNHKSLNAVMKIIDVTGQTVMVRNIAPDETIFHVNVNIFAKGIYIVQITSDEGILEAKMVKQ